MTILPCADHCIRVDKIYDWITRFSNFSIQEQCKIEKELIADEICDNFHIPSSQKTPTSLWINIGIKKISVDFSISFLAGTCRELIIFVDNQEFTRLVAGQSFVGQLQDIQSISAICSDEDSTSFCEGELSICVHYPFNPNDGKEKVNVQCYLSDSCGNRLSLNHSSKTICKEISNPKNRESFTVLLPDKKKVQLQKVNLLKQGFVTVVIHDAKQLIKKCVIPFAEIETLFLCAPNSTKVACEITSFTCRPFIVQLNEDDCQDEAFKIIVNIDICQSIVVSKNVKLEILAQLCQNPRKDIGVERACAPSLPNIKNDCQMLLSKH